MGPVDCCQIIDDTTRCVVTKYGRFLIVLGPLLLPPQDTTQLPNIATAFGHNLLIRSISSDTFSFYSPFFLDADQSAPPLASACDSHSARLVFVPTVSSLSGLRSKPWFLQTLPNNRKILLYESPRDKLKCSAWILNFILKRSILGKNDAVHESEIIFIFYSHSLSPVVDLSKFKRYNQKQGRKSIFIKDKV